MDSPGRQDLAMARPGSRVVMLPEVNYRLCQWLWTQMIFGIQGSVFYLSWVQVRWFLKDFFLSMEVFYTQKLGSLSWVQVRWFLNDFFWPRECLLHLKMGSLSWVRVRWFLKDFYLGSFYPLGYWEGNLLIVNPIISAEYFSIRAETVVGFSWWFN